MANIKLIKAREILDSRGNPTIETKVFLDDGTEGVSSIPSGSSLGKYEAIEIRDNDSNRYGGMGTLQAVNNVNNLIGPGLVNVDVAMQFEIDRWLVKIDGTPNKAKLGANSILSISLAIAKAASSFLKIPLYQYINILF